MKEYLPVGDSDLVEMELKDHGKCLSLTFSFAAFIGGEDKEVRVELFGLKELEYSLVEDQDTCYFVGELWVEESENGVLVGAEGEFYLRAQCQFYEVAHVTKMAVSKNNFAVMRGAPLQGREKVAA